MARRDVRRLQEAYARFRRTALGAACEPVWSQMALHRPAEFNKSHVPAFLADEEPRAYVCVYPFVRSYEWYLLPDEERRAMLAEHGQMARGYPDVRANTVAAFALGDYEWMLAFEADELHRIVDTRPQPAPGARPPARAGGGPPLRRRTPAAGRRRRPPGVRWWGGRPPPPPATTSSPATRRCREGRGRPPPGGPRRRPTWPPRSGRRGTPVPQPHRGLWLADLLSARLG